ncbi:DUF190 domain-containing protein [Saccharicrinis aurantiacus]|uniref:DUF190 domain-containing protein n=1 Tax=Saccharicrinis aurantiacus TaxID=1849719 RepID=UPI0008399378|nr:DUF190 domain-containing protein [Saccharicrinis aurantiacus]
MVLEGNEKKLKIIISESEVIYQRNLYEAIIFAAKKYTMAGVTATKGFLGFGADGPKNGNRGINFKTEPPITIEIVDREERIEDFSKVVSSLLDKANASGIVYIESVNVVCFRKQEDAKTSANHI